MKTYEKKIQELGKEIAEEIINKEKDPKWQIVLEQNGVARSLSNIYNKDIKKTHDDLDNSIRKNLARMRTED
ncbi:MAG: hypothetical protein EBS19_11685 [Spirochaetia bacterium]|nr:hypothetical protein [Spirochaetia bacterium]